MTPRVKICCISSVEEAWTAIRYGASALGLVSAMPSGPGVIDEELIAKIAIYLYLTIQLRALKRNYEPIFYL
ncbi:MAG: hypothetical protein PUP93_19380 [Rhizonema sp. NSF051]|nr:hypothetical protein [Rhizonema sp. NSF051]